MNAKILSERELLSAIENERRQGRTVAFANGCFDLLHVGHIRYLQEAAKAADVLVVALNSDRSARKLKGEGRPVVSEDERAELLAAIRGVDYVTIFDADSPAELIGRLRPDVQCKGTDYTADTVPEAEVVRSYGGRVLIVGDPKDHSSTELIRMTRESRGGREPGGRGEE